MNRKCGLLLMVSGTVLLIAALSLFVYNYFDNKRAGEEAETVLTELREVIEEKTAEQPSGGHKRRKNEETPSVVIDGKYYIGILSLPSLGLELSVIKDWSYSNLRSAPCIYSGSLETFDLVIAAHNYNTHFGRLKYIRGGDEVTFTDMDGNIVRLEVEFSETTAPTAIEYMTAGEYPLTLFTCNYSGQARIAVRCIRSRTE